jgi:type IV secretory pathway VirB9-like protein
MMQQDDTMSGWMRGAVALTLLILGCTQEAPPLPPVPPPPEDLSLWAVPELVQPPRQVAPHPPLREPKPTAAEKIYDFTPGGTYQAPVAVGTPLDMLFERGEEIRNYSGGDPELLGDGQQATRWEVKIGASGKDATLAQHLFVRATETGLKMGLVVTTTKRTYYLTCMSVKTSPVRVIAWHYPLDTSAPAPPKEPGLLPDPQEPMLYHVGYELRSVRATMPEWSPRMTIDDGRKMYIILPEVTLFATAPMVRKIGPNGAALVNVRNFLNVLIVDELAGRLELRVGIGDSAEVVTVARGNLQTIHCPDDPACPIWPAAAQVLARKAVQP